MELFEEKRREAIATLVKLGVAKYVRDLDLYHGRAGDGSDWQVIPNYDNGGNATGNRNVNKVGGLYTATKDVAEEFAGVRALKKHAQPEIHKIVTNDQDAIIFDCTAHISALSDADRKLYYAAMKVLSDFSVTSAMPVKWEFKDVLNYLKTKVAAMKNSDGLISNHAFMEIFSELKNDNRVKYIFHCNLDKLEKFVTDFIGAYNTKHVMAGHAKSVIRAYQEGDSGLHLSESNEDVLISHDYVSAWCSANHIVGTELLVNSVTLNKTVPVYHMFDTKKIMSEKQKGFALNAMLKEFGGITNALENVVNHEDIAKLLQNGSCKEIMEFMQQDSDCNRLYNMSAHIWEGWTVGQHTQAVVGFFDKYYQNDVPEKLRPFIKACLLAHDIGKGYASDKSQQKSLNLKYAPAVYEALCIAPEYQNLIQFVIGQSQTYTSNILLGRSDKSSTMAELQNACKSAFVDALGHEPSSEELDGLKRICIILQECDSGAYTRYAAIQEDNGMMVGGANDRFTESFALNQRGEPRLKCFMDSAIKIKDNEPINSL